MVHLKHEIPKIEDNQRDHLHMHHHTHESKNLGIAFFLNFSFTLIEIIGGIFTNSMAILSDAIHDLGDTCSLGLAWYFQKISGKEKSEKFSYGYERFYLLGAIINAFLLIIGSIFILYKAIPRLLDPQAVHVPGMIALAFLGVIVNGTAVLQLKNGHSLNEKIFSLHLLEDVLSWVAVLIGSLVMLFFDLPVIDPILSVLISIFIFYNVIKNLRYAIKIILQGTPSLTDLNKVREYFKNVPDIKDFHDLHIWSMDGNFNVLTTHLIIKEKLSMDQQELLKSRIKKDLLRMNISHCTLELEAPDVDCEMDDNNNHDSRQQ